MFTSAIQICRCPMRKQVFFTKTNVLWLYRCPANASQLGLLTLPYMVANPETCLQNWFYTVLKKYRLDFNMKIIICPLYLYKDFTFNKIFFSLFLDNWLLTRRSLFIELALNAKISFYSLYKENWLSVRRSIFIFIFYRKLNFNTKKFVYPSFLQKIGFQYEDRCLSFILEN